MKVMTAISEISANAELPQDLIDAVNFPVHNGKTRSVHVLGAAGIWGTVLGIEGSILHIGVDRVVKGQDDMGNDVEWVDGYTVSRHWNKIVDWRIVNHDPLVNNRF